jgi:hypothetical protein
VRQSLMVLASATYGIGCDKVAHKCGQASQGFDASAELSGVPVTEFNASQNAIGHQGAVYLQAVYLDSCHIDDGGGALLVRLHSTTLHLFDSVDKNITCAFAL